MSNKKDSLGDRMKEYYENRAKTYLNRRTPVVIRLDGKAFHSFTKKFEKPYDTVMHSAMNLTLKYLCENIQGCRLGYTQSDEITLFLSDYTKLGTDAWFDYSVQKVCSVSASMATLAFNKFFEQAVNVWLKKNSAIGNDGKMVFYSSRLLNLYEAYVEAMNKGAMFDSRCFNIPEDECCNCAIWRQQDAERNSIQMLGQYHFSSKQLHKKKCKDIIEMLKMEKEVDYYDMPPSFRIGVCCKKISSEDGKSAWELDYDIPLFSVDRDYVNKEVYYRED